MRSAPSFHAQAPALILLVDDNQDGVIARRSVLEELGYSVISAASGEAALELVKQQPFDLLVTDYLMPPHMDGLSLIAELRRRDFQQPIILLTGYAEKLGLNEQETGADLIIQKSANEITQLLRSTKRLLAVPRKPSTRQRSIAATKRKSGTR